MDRPLRSDCISALSKHLGNLQAQLKPVPKDMCSDQYTKGKFTYRYATIQSIIDTARPMLVKHGFILNHSIEGDLLIAILIHVESQQYMEARYKLAYKPECPRSFSGAVTFGMKDTYRMLLGMVADDDTDGHLPD
jgi:hypothetical protein